MATYTCRVQYMNDTDPFATTIFAEPTRAPHFHFNEYLPLEDQLPTLHRVLQPPHKLEDCGLQLSHNGTYLDLEQSIDDQRDDFEGFERKGRNSVIVRTQLTVRVRGIQEKLLNSSGRELRRALFSLKQLFQDDKDLVHEFVSCDGLDCLIKLGSEADQNYQNYILRAIGQIMLYLDGMNGVIEHNETIKWLYSLLDIQHRLVTKSALKLLLVFVEYTETNAQLLLQSTKEVDGKNRNKPWHNLMELLKDEGQDAEIMTYVMTLFNKTLNAIPDQDSFYDITDALEVQGMEQVTQRLTGRSGTDLDLMEQIRIYEFALKHEDGEEDIPMQQKQSLRKARRSMDPATDRKSMRSLRTTPEWGNDVNKRVSLDPKLRSTPEETSSNSGNEDCLSAQRRRRERRRGLSAQNSIYDEGTTPTSSQNGNGSDMMMTLEERRQRIRERNNAMNSDSTPSTSGDQNAAPKKRHKLSIRAVVKEESTADILSASPQTPQTDPLRNEKNQSSESSPNQSSSRNRLRPVIKAESGKENGEDENYGTWPSPARRRKQYERKAQNPLQKKKDEEDGDDIMALLRGGSLSGSKNEDTNSRGSVENGNELNHSVVVTRTRKATKPEETKELEDPKETSGRPRETDNAAYKRVEEKAAEKTEDAASITLKRPTNEQNVDAAGKDREMRNVEKENETKVESGKGSKGGSSKKPVERRRSIKAMVSITKEEEQIVEETNDIKPDETSNKSAEESRKDETKQENLKDQAIDGPKLNAEVEKKLELNREDGKEKGQENEKIENGSLKGKGRGRSQRTMNNKIFANEKEDDLMTLLTGGVSLPRNFKTKDHKHKCPGEHTKNGTIERKNGKGGEKKKGKDETDFGTWPRKKKKDVEEKKIDKEEDIMAFLKGGLDATNDAEEEEEEEEEEVKGHICEICGQNLDEMYDEEEEEEENAEEVGEGEEEEEEEEEEEDKTKDEYSTKCEETLEEVDKEPELFRRHTQKDNNMDDLLMILRSGSQSGPTPDEEDDEEDDEGDETSTSEEDVTIKEKPKSLWGMSSENINSDSSSILYGDTSADKWARLANPEPILRRTHWGLLPTTWIPYCPGELASSPYATLPRQKHPVTTRSSSVTSKPPTGVTSTPPSTSYTSSTTPRSSSRGTERSHGDGRTDSSSTRNRSSESSYTDRRAERGTDRGTDRDKCSSSSTNDSSYSRSNREYRRSSSSYEPSSRKSSVSSRPGDTTSVVNVPRSPTSPSSPSSLYSQNVTPRSYRRSTSIESVKSPTTKSPTTTKKEPENDIMALLSSGDVSKDRSSTTSSKGYDTLPSTSSSNSKSKTDDELWEKYNSDSYAQKRKERREQLRKYLEEDTPLIPSRLERSSSTMSTDSTESSRTSSSRRTDTTPSTSMDVSSGSVSYRRRRNRDTDNESIASTDTTETKKEELTMSSYVPRSRRRHEAVEEKPAEEISAENTSSTKTSERRPRDRTTSESSDKTTENKELKKPDYLTNGIAARRSRQAEEKKESKTEKTSTVNEVKASTPQTKRESDTRSANVILDQLRGGDVKAKPVENGDISAISNTDDETSSRYRWRRDKEADKKEKPEETKVVNGDTSSVSKPKEDVETKKKDEIREPVQDKPADTKDEEKKLNQNTRRTFIVKKPQIQIEETEEKKKEETSENNKNKEPSEEEKEEVVVPLKPVVTDTKSAVRTTDKNEQAPKVIVENGKAETDPSDRGNLLSVTTSDQEENGSSGKVSRKISTTLQNVKKLEERKVELQEVKEKEEEEKKKLQEDKEILNNSGAVQSMHKQLQQQQEKSEDQKEKTGPRGDVSGKISQAIEGIKVSNVAPKAAEPVAPKEDESKKEEEAWEEVLKLNDRELRVNKWDFTDLCRDDDKDVLKPIPLMMGIVPHMTAADGAPPPPPVPGLGGPPPPPPVPGAPPPPPAIGGPGAPPPPPPVIDSNTFPKSKKKKTVRLFWKETQPETMTLGRNGIKSTIWTQLDDVNLDSKKLEHLFEYRGKDLITKDHQKAMEANKKNFITVLDPKKSNAINIGLTVLPQPRSIKQAILNMDSMVMNKEGVEKLLSMVPSEEEVARIQEAMLANPDVPLGSAEQFLHMLSTISGLEARLNLWLFKMDYDNMEEEVAEPMADLKKGIEDLRESKTFKKILSTLLAIGNFLNGGRTAAGFNLEYLSKVPEVKDTVHKQSLLHHLCATVMEQFPDSSDFFSEVGTISRCAKVDFDQLTINLAKLEEQCKVSWDHLQVISQHEKTSQNKNKLHDFLQDCAKRIIVLKIVHRRVSNRFNKFLLYLGMSTSAAREVKISDFCRIISEFALEYRSARERIIEQEKKKANHRKRNKTRGKMITENFSISKDSAEDAKLKELLSTQQGTAPGDETLQSRQRARPSMSGRLNMSMTADEEVADEQTDEMIQILVNTAKNTSSRSAPRERKRTRNTNRKSLRRTLKSGLTDAERQALGLLHAKSSEVHV